MCHRDRYWDLRNSLPTLKIWQTLSTTIIWIITCMRIDDTQLIEYTTASDIPNAIMKLQNCVESIHKWCRSRRLQLNPTKTELIWFGSKASLKKTVHLDLNLYIGADIIKPVGVVRDLGVFLDSELNMDQHVKTVVRSCFFHLRRLRSVRRILGGEVTLGLVSAFVTTRLDYSPSSQDFLRRQSIHFNESRTQLPDLLLELGTGADLTGNGRRGPRPIMKAEGVLGLYNLCCGCGCEIRQFNFIHM